MANHTPSPDITPLLESVYPLVSVPLSSPLPDERTLISRTYCLPVIIIVDLEWSVPLGPETLHGNEESGESEPRKESMSGER